MQYIFVHICFIWTAFLHYHTVNVPGGQESQFFLPESVTSVTEPGLGLISWKLPGLQIVCRVVVYDCHKIKAKCYRSKNPRARRQIIVKYLAITYLHIREHSSVIKQINILLYLSACSFKCGSLCPLDFQSHLWKACLCCSAAGSGWWSFKCQLKFTHTLIEPIPQLCVWNHICKWQRKQSYYDLLSLFNSCVLQCDGKKWGSLRCKLQLFWLKWVIFLSRTPA